MDFVDLLQWPAMAVTVSGAWFVGSTHKRRRLVGFLLYIVSNALWIAWGIHAKAYALISLQIFLAGMNVRGISKIESAMS